MESALFGRSGASVGRHHLVSYNQCVAASAPGAFQILMVPSLQPEASFDPSGLKQTTLTESVCPVSVLNSWPCCGSQSLIILSDDAEAMRVPLGWNASEEMPPRCPKNCRFSLPVFGSQTSIALSRVPDTSSDPSGVKAWRDCGTRCFAAFIFRYFLWNKYEVVIILVFS